MPACATQKKIADSRAINNLFLPVPDTDFHDFLDEVDELARFAPEIIASIEKDLDTEAQRKKRLRLEDRKFIESFTEDFQELNIEEREFLTEELELSAGRPRMPANAVYVFLMIRGFLGSLTSKQARRFLRESISLYGYLQEQGLKMPGSTTSHSTRRRLLH